MTNKTRIKFDVEQEDNMAFGNIGLIDNSPSGDPNAEVWRAENRLNTQKILDFLRTSFLVFIDQEGRNVQISSWPEKEGTLTQTDLLDSKDNQVQELIYKIRTSIFIPHRERLAKRLFTLFEDAKEEDPVCFGIADGSLLNFYNFLHLHTNLKCPAISLTPEDNNIYASWSEGQNKTFSVLFLPNGVDARFVILKPNDKYPEQQITFSGLVTTDILIESVKPYGVLDWISDER